MAANFLMNLFSLPALVFLPFFAGLMIISPFFPDNPVKIRRFAKGFAVFTLLYTLFFNVFLGQNTGADGVFSFAFSFPFDIIPALGARFTFGLDQLSSLMCILTAFITLLALIASKSMITSKQKLFYSLMLILQGSVLGIFAAGDLFTLFVFWEIEIVPVFFLISMWGGSEARKSAQKFALFTFSGSVFMLVAMALIYAYGADYGLALDFNSLINNAKDFPVVMQLVVSIGFLLAFGVKLPVFGLHPWLADAHTSAPTPVSMVLAGVLLKTGAYGLIRINFQMFYEIFQILAPALILLGAINVLWASFAAIAQNDIKRMIAFSSIAHMGTVLIGIASFTVFGLTGAIFCMIAHGLISAGLFMASGVIYIKFKTRKLELLGGIAHYAPHLTAITMFLGIAAMAVPLTMGFPGEIMSLAGGFNSPLADTGFFASNLIQTSAILAALGIILSGAYILKLLHKSFFGLLEYDFGTVRLTRHQTAVLVILSLGVLIFGIYPMGIIDKINVFTVENVQNIMRALF